MSKPSDNTLRGDFHCHSMHSDGVLTPKELATAMKDSKVEVFALTDHDTTSGVKEAQVTAQSLGITCIPGIELTIQWAKGTFHLLGLGMSDTHVLQQHLDELGQRREERNEQILAKLRGLGIDIDMHKLQRHSSKKEGEILNRSHIAAYLTDLGHCQNYYKAFQDYLANGAPAYVGIDGPSPEVGIQWIHDAGGRAFIAHPHSLKLSDPELQQHLHSWRSFGLDGLETSHPRIRQKDRKYLLKLCKEFGMEYCGGSDYHCGENVLGLGSDGRPIEIPRDFSYLENFF